MSGNAAKRALLSRVCWRNVSSTVNPFVASRMTGEHVAQRLGAEPVERGLPRGERARHADRDAPMTRAFANGYGCAGRRVDERVRRHARGRGLASVDRGHLSGRRVEVDEVPAAADAGAVRLGHAERGCRRHCGIRRVAAVAQHLEPDARSPTRRRTRPRRRSRWRSTVPVVSSSRHDGRAGGAANDCADAGRPWRRPRRRARLRERLPCGGERSGDERRR